MAQRSNSKRKPPARVARAPSWTGPLIGRTVEKADEYLSRMQRLIAGRGAHFYFDTSFLMWLAKLGAPAREQFMAWQTGVGEDRFHVPLWAAHEFFKHRLKKTVANELGVHIKSFDSAASNLYERLRVSCSDQLFGFEKSGALFLDEYVSRSFLFEGAVRGY